MNIHYLQHVPFEDLGMIADWIDENGYHSRVSRLYQGEALPNVNDIDWLIVMGGPMGVYDEDQYPWLVDEKRCIERAIAKGRVVLGICLGAQLIANVLGARVYPHTRKEIGWFPITLTREGAQSPLFTELPSPFEVFHWHGDTFDLPDGATHVASSAFCPHQAFVYEQRVIGLQFHLEMTRAGVVRIIEHCADELVESRSIQQAGEMMAFIDHLAETHRVMDTLLHRIRRANSREADW